MQNHHLDDPKAKREYLDSLDWVDIVKESTAFVIHYLNHLVHGNYKEWNLPEGNRAEDIALQAYEDVYNGRRNWDHNKYPEIRKYIKYSVCRSLLSNLFSKPHIQSLIRLDIESYFGEGEEESEVRTNSNDAIEVTSLSIDAKSFLKRLRDELRCGNNPLDEVILLLTLEGHGIGDIAEGLKVSVEDVYNAKKRIRRKAKGIPEYSELSESR